MELHLVSLIDSFQEIGGQVYQNPFLCCRRAIDSGPGPGSPVVYRSPMAYNLQGYPLSPWGSLDGGSWRGAYIKMSTAVSHHIQSDPPRCSLTGCLDTAQRGSRYTIDSSGSADDVSCLSLLDTPCQDPAAAHQACSASRTTTPGSSICHPAPAPKTSPITPSSGRPLNANLPPDLPKEIIIPLSLLAPPLAAISRIHAPPLRGAQVKGGAKCATAGAEAAEESQLPLTPEQALRVGNVNWRKRPRRSLVELEQVRSPGLWRKAVKSIVYSTDLLNNPFQPYKLFAQTGGGCTNTEHHVPG